MGYIMQYLIVTYGYKNYLLNKFTMNHRGYVLIKGMMFFDDFLLVITLQPKALFR